MPTTLAFYQPFIIAISFLQEDTTADFSDLGNKLLAGFVIAVVIAVTYAILKLRWRDKNPSAQFLSINPASKNDEPAKGVRD